MKLNEEKAKQWLETRYLTFLQRLVENAHKYIEQTSISVSRGTATKLSLKSVNTPNDIKKVIYAIDKVASEIENEFNQIYSDFIEKYCELISKANQIMAYSLTEYYILRTT